MAISVEQFIQKSQREILIPGFSVGDEPIEIKVRTLSIVNMLSRKTIPNALMPAVEKLFKLGGNVTEEQAEAIATENIDSMVEFLAFICDKAMIQPTYEEVGEYMTEEQMMAVFNSTQGTVNSLKSFRDK